jgi:hypothetical protein
MGTHMNQSSLTRLVRLSLGLAVLAIPLLALLALASITPVSERAQAAAPQDSNFPQVVTQTQTAIAATSTALAQTAIAQTQTALPATQTSIARTQTAIAQPSATAILVDVFEPNDTIQTAYTIATDAIVVCGATPATLWPPGDVDFYRFQLKVGSAYEIFTSNLSAGLDTFLIVYDPQGNQIAQNDDYEFGNRASRVVISAQANGFYYARITNQSSLDPAGKTYCFQVREIQGTATPTPFPTSTRVAGADSCEPNNSFDQACLLGVGQTFNANFVPLLGQEIDNDFYRLWVRPGFYTCSTFDLSSVNDTNIILYNQNREGLAGSQQTTRESVVSVQINYTGWMYALVGPVVPITYAESGAYTYSFRCVEAEPTATPTVTPRPVTGVGPGPAQPTPTPFVFPTFPPSPTPFTFETATPTPRPIVQINPLPTATPVGGPQLPFTINVTVYYDSNLNYTPEISEGIADIAVALYEQATGQLLAFGYTNEAGMIQFSGVTAVGPIRVSVPYLKYSQLTTNSQTNILLRVAPQPLPIGIP